MSQEKKRQSLVSYPREFKPLLDQELEEGGYFTYRQLIGAILAEHFGVTWNEAQRRIDTKAPRIRAGEREGYEDT